MLKCKSPSWPILSGWDFNHLENTETKRAQSQNDTWTTMTAGQLNAGRGAMVMPHKHTTRWAFCLIKQCSGKFPYKKEMASGSFMFEPLHSCVKKPCTVGPSQRWTILRSILDWWGAPLLPLFSKYCCQFHPNYWEKARTHPAWNICPKTLACQKFRNQHHKNQTPKVSVHSSTTISFSLLASQLQWLQHWK